MLLCRSLPALRQRLNEQDTNQITGNLSLTLAGLTQGLKNALLEPKLSEGDNWFLFGVFINNIVGVEDMWKSGCFERVFEFVTAFEANGGSSNCRLPYQVVTTWLSRICLEFSDRMWEYDMDAGEAVKLLN